MKSCKKIYVAVYLSELSDWLSAQGRDWEQAESSMPAVAAQ